VTSISNTPALFLRPGYYAEQAEVAVSARDTPTSIVDGHPEGELVVDVLDTPGGEPLVRIFGTPEGIIALGEALCEVVELVGLADVVRDRRTADVVRTFPSDE
jgi:hypothetical protein